MYHAADRFISLCIRFKCHFAAYPFATFTGNSPLVELILQSQLKLTAKGAQQAARMAVSLPPEALAELWRSALARDPDALLTLDDLRGVGQ